MLISALHRLSVNVKLLFRKCIIVSEVKPNFYESVDLVTQNYRALYEKCRFVHVMEFILICVSMPLQ